MKPIGQMDQLPLEVLEKILSFCSVNDRAKCRLVSRAFKEAAEISLRSVTHLNIEPTGRSNWPDRVKNELPKSYCDEIFLHKPLVDVWVKYDVPKELFFFLGQYCPNLQVVSAISFELEYGQLVQIASSLQFFHCMDLFIPLHLEDDSESLFTPFQQLEGFQVSDFSQELDVLFAEYLRMRERRMFTRKTPDGRIFLKMPLEFMDQAGISCLSIDFDYDALVQQIPEALAQCLVDLTVESEPPAQFCQFPLPKLQYLRVRQQRVSTEPNQLFCQQLTPNLKSFEFDGKVDMSMLRQLMSYIHSLEKLQCASLSLFTRYDDENGQLVDSFPLPPKLTELRVNAIFPFRNLSTSLRSLSMTERQFSMNLFSKERMFDFNFPNLEFFQCECSGPKGMFEVFLQSLSKCCKLVTFRLELKLEERPDASQVQSLIDILQQNPRLSHLQLDLHPDGPGKDTRSPPEHRGETVFLRQEHFPSLKRVEFELPHEMVYYPTDSFYRLKMTDVYDSSSTHYLQEMKLTPEFSEDFSLTAPSVIPVFSSQMDKLVHLEVDLTPKPQHALSFHSLASQLHKINNLRRLQLSYLEPMMESPSLDLVAEHKSHLLELQKVEPFFSGQNFECFFTQTASNDATSQQLSLRPADAFGDFILELVCRPHNREVGLQFPSPGNLERLELKTTMSLRLSALTSQSLSSLEIDGDIGVPFDLPNLRHFRLKQRLKLPSLDLLDSLRKSPQLLTFELSIQSECSALPDAPFVTSLLQVTSQLKHLQSLVLDVGHFIQQVTKKEGQVSLHQENFPSLTKLFLNLPFYLTFHPLDVFDCIEISSDGYSLRGEMPSLVYEIFEGPGTVDIKSETMSKLAKLQIDCSCSLQQLSSLKQSHITEVHLDRWRESFKVQFEADVMDWVASLPHLRKLVTVPLSQADVERFLRNLRTTGPLTIDIGAGSQEVSRMEDQLHQLVSCLMASGVISSFKSTWTCKTEQFRRRTRNCIAFAFAIASIPFCCPPLQH